MIVKKTKKKLTIQLEPQCTILQVEKDFDQLSNLVEKANHIEINGKQVEAMDTAYFQFMLSVKTSATQGSKKLTVSGKKEPLLELEAIYGIAL